MAQQFHELIPFPNLCGVKFLPMLDLFMLLLGP